MKDIIYTTSEYNALPQVRQSYLKECLKSTLDYKIRLESEWKPSKVMIFGSLVDNIWLDRSQLERDFIYWNQDDRPDHQHSMKAKSNVEWMESLQASADLQGKILVPIDEIRRADALVNAIRSPEPGALHAGNTPEAAMARDYLDHRPGEKQKVIFWTDPETGIEMKGRLDKLNEHEIVDLKVYANFGPNEFGRDAAKYSLDMQAVLYMKATGRTRFVWVVIQPEPPYHVCIYKMDEGSREYNSGEKKLRICLDRLKTALDTGIYSGIGSMGMISDGFDPVTNIYDFMLPHWHLSRWE